MSAELLDSPTLPPVVHTGRRSDALWLGAALSVIGLGAALRLVLGGGGTGARSAAVLLLVLALGAWVAGWLLGSPRTAFFVSLGAVLLGNMAALPPRSVAEYDDRIALYRGDQTLAGSVDVPTPAPRAPVLTLLVEPSTARAPVGLAATIGSTRLEWRCPFVAGLQRVALPLPIAPVAGRHDLVLSVTGAPTREADYVLIYLSAVRGGAVAEVVDAAQLDAATTRCTSVG